MIPDLGRLIKMFKDMNDNGLDTKAPLKWGFYFIHEAPENLRLVFDEMKGHGYTLEYIQEIEGKCWRMFVTKIDVLTPEKLHERNIAFNELAEYCDVDVYDGWDVDKPVRDANRRKGEATRSEKVN